MNHSLDGTHPFSLSSPDLLPPWSSRSPRSPSEMVLLNGFPSHHVTDSLNPPGSIAPTTFFLSKPLAMYFSPTSSRPGMDELKASCGYCSRQLRCSCRNERSCDGAPWHGPSRPGRCRQATTLLISLDRPGRCRQATTLLLLLDQAPPTSFSPKSRHDVPRL